MLRRITNTILRNRQPRGVVPPGLRVYAIGDIHGRLDLLQQIQEMIAADLAAATDPVDPVAVFVGDYVDRGTESRGVIEYLRLLPFAGFQHVFLLGNHERSFLDFLKNPSIGQNWFGYGGQQTVESYNVNATPSVPGADRFEVVRKALVRAVPNTHLEFLQALELTWQIGDYLFVHAGIYPGVPLERQNSDDLIWIREEFLSSRLVHEKIIVHGHSISEKPQVKRNRIGIDTGAFASNVLTCLVLEAEHWRFIQTA